ncbi:translation initiation factor IF-6 [Methanonatronarchaeum sp. AMET-Sl]|uniref:translation initiation factor IF-6 n=1 Tax=Methanonatronarchaeum sp. AMET-Sl TaxID=3037654 RepID=UPI00244DFFCC|nr:translation initiation factor IF-6 [Methanonatronarchaeum sp. AMET-Sl]WGI16767.1 translation initiation factor IF-6 [Methanonatronarchaeum sp. AMET-Sl]
MLFERLEVFGSQMVGVYCSASNDYALVPTGMKQKVIKAIEKTLEVEAIELTIGDSVLVGCLSEINKNGILVSDIAGEKEIEILKNETGLEIEILSEGMNTSGNLVLSNDTNALVHPDLDGKYIKKIQETLDVEIIKTAISGIKNVGAAGVVNNKGILLHPMVNENELNEISSKFGLNAAVGTFGYGMPMVGSGVVANNNGFLTGKKTTGPELGRIEEALFSE